MKTNQWDGPYPGDEFIGDPDELVVVPDGEPLVYGKDLYVGDRV